MAQGCPQCAEHSGAAGAPGPSSHRGEPPAALGAVSGAGCCASLGGSHSLRGARRSPGEVLGNAVAFCPVPKASLPPRVLACPAALSAPCLSHCLHHCLPRCAVCPTAVASTAFACPTGPRELAHPGSPDAGRAAVCIAGHHPVHGLLGHGELRCGRAGQRPLSGLVLG